MSQCDGAEKRLIDAITRIQSGDALDPDVKKAILNGKSAFSFSLVAKEAGVSRTLIGHKNCRYPALRMKLIALQKPSSSTKQIKSAFQAKVLECESLKSQLAMAQTMLAGQAIRLADLEKQLGASEEKIIPFPRKDKRLKNRAG